MVLEWQQTSVGGWLVRTHTSKRSEKEFERVGQLPLQTATEVALQWVQCTIHRTKRIVDFEDLWKMR